ncbi:MAG: hypothetical protein WD448_02315 [Woeseia sp.]
MHTRLSLKYSMELVASLLTVAAVLAVLQSFIIGRHFIIPTLILVIAVILGNLARYGYRDHTWAKQVLFWFGVVLTLHAFFALFWARAYRQLLGASFEWICIAVIAAMTFFTWQYASRNSFFR